jgi:hypothetical protein
VNAVVREREQRKRGKVVLLHMISRALLKAIDLSSIWSISTLNWLVDLSAEDGACRRIPGLWSGPSQPTTTEPSRMSPLELFRLPATSK